MKRLKPTTTDRARQMRRDPTSAERLFWKSLRLLKTQGFRFTRQLPVGPYFLDFACRTARLAIELDGEQHGDRVEYDRERTAFLEAQGWRVVRFPNAMVLADPARAVEAILAGLCGDAPFADIQPAHPAVDSPSPTVDPALSLP